MAERPDTISEAFAKYRDPSERLNITLNEDSVPLFALASAFAEGVEESLRVLASQIEELSRSRADT